jgi:hypothetical protein
LNVDENNTSTWRLVDIADDFLSDLPLLIHSLNHGPMCVYPWPTQIVGDPYSEEKSILLLSMGFVPSATKPSYADPAFECFSVGFFHFNYKILIFV